MKITLHKSIVLASIILIPLAVSSQISITSSDMPSANDTIRYSIVQNSIGVDFKATGANKIWDFTKLKSNSQGLYEYKNSSATPYILNFGFSALGLKIADSLGAGQIGFRNVYNFFKKSTAKWENVGIGFQLSVIPLPQVGKHTNSDEIYQFPLNYNDKDSATFTLKVPLTAIVNIGNYFQDGNRVSTVDGWGKISTPYKSDIECIRIKSIITEKDSLSLAITGQQPINFGFPATRIEYKWLSKTEKIPILEVTGTELGGTFTPTTVRYRDNYQSTTSGPLAPVADFKSSKLTALKSDIITLTDLSTNSPTSYAWTITPPTFVFANGTDDKSKNPQVSFTANGKYTVKLVAANSEGSGTETKTNYITIDDNAGILNLNTSKTLAYPNPASDLLNIEIKSLANQSIKLLVFDMDGKNIENMQFSIENTGISLNTTKLSNGNYNAIVITDNGIYNAPFTIIK